MTSSLAQDFASIFDSAGARTALASFGRHLTLPTFSLTTTSLRHLRKWYDRLEDIDNGIIGSHPNYCSDPESIGLVHRSRSGWSLTRAGREFLATKDVGYNNPRLAEYFLLDVLYFQRHNHRTKAARFLRTKRNNLQLFLNGCSPTPTKHLLIEYPRLLTIAEYISEFDGALIKFLNLAPEVLVGLANLGEPNFEALGASDRPRGFANICHKIGSDYTRAADRRLNMVISMALLEIRQSLLLSGKKSDKLTIPFPYCNLISETDINELAPLFTTDIEIVPDEQGFTVLLKLIVGATDPLPPVERISLRQRRTRRPRRRSGRRKPSKPARRARDYIMFDTSLGFHAENYFQDSRLNRQYGGRVIRIGHTDFESVALSDGMVPGADFIIGTLDSPERYIEVKASRTYPPVSIRLTVSEYVRAKACHESGIPYELFILTYDDAQSPPRILQTDRFPELISNLSFEDLLTLEIPISIT